MKSSFQIPVRKLKTRYGIRLNKELCYLLMYAGYAALSMIDNSLLNIHLIMRLYIVIVVLVHMILLISKRRYSFFQVAAILCIMGVFSISAIVTDRTNMIVTGLFVVNSDVADFNKIVRVSILATLPTLLFVIACSQVGIIPDYIFMHKEMRAHALGYSYYATVPYTVMFNMLSYLFLREKKLRLLEVIALLIINHVVYIISTTRLTYFLFVGILAMFLLFVRFDLVKSFNKKTIRILATVAFPFTFIMTIWCAKQYSLQSVFWRMADDIVNTRLALSHKAFDMYTVKLLGQYIEMNGNAYGNVTTYYYFYIDSGYVYTLLANGLLFTVIILSMYSFMLWNACRMNQKGLLIWLLAIMVFSVINNPLVSVIYNPLLLYFMIAVKQMRFDNNIRSLKNVKLFRTVLEGSQVKYE